MKTYALLVLFALAAAPPASADSGLVLDPKADEKKPSPALSGRRLFVVETDSDSAAESLNRVSGEIDTGFLRSDNAYQSDDHYRAGPFGRQDVMDASED